MTFNPLTEMGIPLERQLRNWRELDVDQVDPDDTERDVTIPAHQGRIGAGRRTGGTWACAAGLLRSHRRPPPRWRRPPPGAALCGVRLAMLMTVLVGLATAFVVLLGWPAWTVPPPVAAVPATAPGPPGPQLAADPPASPARADSCSGRDLRVREQDVGDAPGGFYGRLVLTNAGRRPCTVQGYPVIEATQAGRVTNRSLTVPVPAGDPGPLILLLPEQSASAAFRYDVGDLSGCPRYDRTRVLVPHAVAPLPLDEVGAAPRPGLRVCGYRVQSFTGGIGARWRAS